MMQQLIENLIVATSSTIQSHSDELSDLDRAIGDGDHGHNMSRGFTAISEISDELSGMQFGPAVTKAGMTLVMKVGGASGPLFGSFLMAAGKAGDDVPKSRDEVVALMEEGISSIKARGKSDVGAKTMLDVLVPVKEALKKADGSYISVARTSADEAVAATKDMLATKGRASFLGERSIGHIDPGGRSVALLIHAICDVLEGPWLKM
jgi:dihydroxyacetone kinase-like protein